MCAFTIEKCNNGSINFLGKQLTLVDQKIKSKWYSKPEKGEKTLEFNGITPFSWKKSNIIGFINRIIYSSYDDQTIETDLFRMRRILLKNKYPAQLIDNLIKQHKDNFKAKRNYIWKEISENGKLHPKSPKVSREEKTIWSLKIPYSSPRIDRIVKKLKYVIKNSFKDIELNIIYSSKKLFSVFKPLLKPATKPTEKQGVIYKFICDCSESYIGETDRMLKYRINEHFYQ